jgi:hypothetical protein
MHTSHVKNLMTLIPPRSSCSSLARLSVHSMAFLRMVNSLFITQVCIGLPIKKIANPASALGPKLTSRRTRQMIRPMGEDHAIWKNLGRVSKYTCGIEGNQLHCAEIYSRYICRDVVDESAVRECCSGAGCEEKTAIKDCRNQSPSY